MISISFCKNLHHAYPTSGIYNVQLILESNYMPLTFEINTRISTTFCLALASLNYDPFELFLNNKNVSVFDAKIKNGLRLERHWKNHIF